MEEEKDSMINGHVSMWIWILINLKMKAIVKLKLATN